MHMQTRRAYFRVRACIHTREQVHVLACLRKQIAIPTIRIISCSGQNVTTGATPTGSEGVIELHHSFAIRRCEMRTL
jgi:hypothetical protein